MNLLLEDIEIRRFQREDEEHTCLHLYLHTCMINIFFVFFKYIIQLNIYIYIYIYIYTYIYIHIYIYIYIYIYILCFL